MSLPVPGPFTFDGTEVRGGEVLLRYRLGAHDFTERIELPFDLPDTPQVAAAVRALHLVAGVSYYKCGVPTTLEAPALSEAERALVTALYDEGLRELAYRNDLELPVPVDLHEADGDPPEVPAPAGGLTGALVPIGGGKDSALVGEMVPDAALMAVNPLGAHEALAQRLGRELVRVRRTLDPLLRELVEAGAVNGHVPVTAINSAVAVLVAVATGRRDVLMGLERSASEPTLVTDDGVEVNHQFSKSDRAERLLAAVFAPTGVRYFSLLRPMTELAIGTAVADRGLGGHILSCNRAFTIWSGNEASINQRPCGECAKCLFTALMLAPSSEPEQVREHFGRDLLDDPTNLDEVRALWSSEKPFDCVGERHESAAAVVMLAHLEQWRDQAVPSTLAAEAEGVLAEIGARARDYLRLDPTGGLPEEYRPLVDDLAGPLDEVAGRLDGA